MANITITNLPTVPSLNGTEAIPAVQSGVTVRLTVDDISNYVSLNSPAYTVAIGSNIAGSTAGYGLYVDAGKVLGQFAYGTGVFTALGVAVGSTGAPVLFNGAGGTPTSLTLTNATGLPLSIGVTGNLPVTRLNSGTGATSSTFWRGDGTWAAPTVTGTVTSVAQTFTGGIISVGGSPVTTSGTLALTVAGTSGGIPYFSSGTTWASSAALASNALVIGGGAGVAPATTTTGTGVLTALGNTTNAASGVAVKDANANLSANGFFETFTTITAAGTVTTLTASSAYSFIVNGSGGHTIQLPDATTLPVGAVYLINNNQISGTVVVRNNSATTIVTLQSGSYVEITLTANSPAAGTWDVHALLPSAVSWSTNTLTWTGTIASGTTWNGAAVGILYGGTGATTKAAGFNALSPVTTTGDLIVGNGTNSSTRLGIGSTSQILTVVGGTAAWAAAPTTTPAGSTTQIQYNNAGTLAGSANMTFDGTYISDGIGNVRNVPQNSQIGAYVLVAGDNGKHISITTGGVTVPSGIFSAGQTVSIFNNSTSNQTITQGSSVTLRQAGTASTGNRTLPQYGICTVLCVASNTFVIHGTGLT